MRWKFGVLVTLLLWTSAQSQYQIGKGSYSISGSMAYNSAKFDGESKSGTQFLFNPNFHYFIEDRISIGLNISFEQLRNPEAGLNNVERDLNIITFGPSVRYYFGRRKFFPFVQTGYYYSHIQYLPVSEKVSSHALNVGAGFDYYLTDNLGIEVLASFDDFDNRVKGYAPKIKSAAPNNFSIGSTQIGLLVGIFAAF